jgi:hypothetical protein
MEQIFFWLFRYKDWIEFVASLMVFICAFDFLAFVVAITAVIRGGQSDREELDRPLPPPPALTQTD